jgi:streptogramin lyase
LPARPLAIDARGVSWLSDFGGGRVLSFDPANGDIAEFASLARNAEPYGITAASSRLIWYNEKSFNQMGIESDGWRASSFPPKGV